MHFLTTKIGKWLVEAVLDWIAQQTQDQIAWRRFRKIHGKRWDLINDQFQKADTLKERIEAARRAARESV